MTYQAYSDEELLVFLQNDSTKAFEEIYRRYWYKLFGIAYHQTGTREEAEELVHDLFEQLWNRRGQSAIRHLSTYLVVAIKHLTTNYIKSQITHRKYQEYLIMNELQHTLATDQAVQFTDLSKAVDEAMKKLPEKSVEIFKLSRFENQSVRDIAQRMNLTEKAVEYHITKSLKVLKEQLKAFHSDN
ncbi:sigma-70 family RNA polymerase sigma factor [Fibrisoma montanum]|uniref:Sigma-70 family RNA polymerase sigma factor n=1 Tax=Fibrisoma montanum TaxID=2305895 RepID=A0A418M5P1_9BACT|nr:sigma-70 family RNA polymerase sigma factor [Fibrisoma montanum]RIV21193.1 sigma-70 family RNA polymerase sigma factor [Fibrisoma montanum]